MEIRQITKGAWSQVEEVAREIVNASEAGDELLVSVHTNRLMALLDKLEQEFGPHPEFYDTRADFLEDSSERMRLYQQALKLAVEKGDAEVKAEVLESIAALQEELAVVKKT